MFAKNRSNAPDTDWRSQERRAEKRLALAIYGGGAALLVLSWSIANATGATLSSVMAVLAFFSAAAATVNFWGHGA